MTIFERIIGGILGWIAIAVIASIIVCWFIAFAEGEMWEDDECD
jgi:hypothetical protein